MILGAALLLTAACGPRPVYVHFDTGMESPRSDSQRAIDEAVLVLESHPELHAGVIGHTDGAGAKGLNKQLSLRRARSVRDALVARHIDWKRVTVAARGEESPIGNNGTEEGRAQNRRTEIFFFDPMKGGLEVQYGAHIEISVQ
jgi:outer membrane protein OmpA-like peptidoglycan-associated protein